MQFSRTKPLADDLSMRDGVVDMPEIKLFITSSQWCDVRDSRFKGCQFMRRVDAKQRHVKSWTLANANDHPGANDRDAGLKEKERGKKRGRKWPLKLKSALSDGHVMRDHSCNPATALRNVDGCLKRAAPARSKSSNLGAEHPPACGLLKP